MIITINTKSVSDNYIICCVFITILCQREKTKISFSILINQWQNTYCGDVN